MARDNHPRARQAAALARKKPARPRYDRVLIVCEGSKTEPHYFDEIRQAYRIPTAHITVLPSALGTEPRQVVDSAQQEFLKSREYERVYAVFDRDDHLTWSDALAQSQRLDRAMRNDEKREVRFQAVPTVPCFELWLLLHFEEVHAFGHRSEIIARLRERIAGYEKGSRGIYALTESGFDEAAGRAQRLRGRFEPVVGTDPYTTADELVALLKSIKQ